jgi:SAM-dependent methyltransferase
MKTQFENIYRRGDWINSSGGTESGPGSSVECSQEYLTFLSEFVKTNNIKSILDIGCGDFNLMRHFDFGGVNYKGIDLVDFVIDRNNQKYQTSNISFECRDILVDPINVNQYDLLLIKDVFQHLNNNTIVRILNTIKSAKRILITNDYTLQNNECTIGGYRPVNVEIDPFGLNGRWVFEWNSCGFFKKCFLINSNYL